MEVVNHGALISPPDPDDFIFERMVSEMQDYINKQLPESFDLREYIWINGSTLNIRNQENRGTCAACAAAIIKEIQENKEHNHNVGISSEFIYYHRSNKPIDGMYGRNVFQILQKIGSVPESIYPYGTKTPPSNELYEIALTHRIANYARVSTIDGVKRALIDIGPIYMQLPLYSTRPHFWRKTVDEPNDRGHAVVIIGYTNEGFILLNSWGADWNGNGYIIFPYSDWGLQWECWVCIDKTYTSPYVPRKIKGKKQLNTCVLI